MDVPIRWGLCCLVVDAPISFRSATHAYVSRLGEEQRLAYLNGIALHNATALVEVLEYCRRLEIRAFRVMSQLFPLATHPVSGYGVDDLRDAPAIRKLLDAARETAASAGIRLSLHPDQFVVLNSVREEVVASAVGELEWQSEVAELLGADVVCLHGGSMAGGPDEAVARLVAGVARLSPRARSLLALENDDRSFPVVELLAVCLATGIPLVLDAHHHRVLPGGLTLEEATDWALATWDGREPHFHLSSPRAGWEAGDPRPHADLIDPDDVPRYWIDSGVPLTIDLEAKAKERAIVALREAMPWDAVRPDP